MKNLMQNKRWAMAAYFAVILIAAVAIFAAYPREKSSAPQQAPISYPKFGGEPSKQIVPPTPSTQEEYCFNEPSNPLRKQALVVLQSFAQTKIIKKISLLINGQSILVTQETKMWPNDTYSKIDPKYLPCLDLGSTAGDDSSEVNIRVQSKDRNIVVEYSKGGEDADFNPTLRSAKVIDEQAATISVVVSTVGYDLGYRDVGDAPFKYIVDLKTGTVMLSK